MKIKDKDIYRHVLSSPSRQDFLAMPSNKIFARQSKFLSPHFSHLGRGLFLFQTKPRIGSGICKETMALGEFQTISHAVKIENEDEEDE